MRRKKGAMIPIENLVITAAESLYKKGVIEFYGFQIAKELKAKNPGDLTKNGTIYRVLARLEKRGCLNSWWENPKMAAKENRLRRKYYTLRLK